MTDAPSTDLIELARAHGVATEYWDWQGQHVTVPVRTIVAVLAALGEDASTDDAVRAALTGVQDREWRRTLPPVVVMRAGEPASLAVHVPHGSQVAVSVRLEEGGAALALDQVDRWVDPRVVDGEQVGEATFALPAGLPLGWHEVVATVAGTDVTCPLVVTPDRLEVPASLADRPASGVMTQLYATRSSRSWGMGDAADLAELAAWAGSELGSDFVLVNPLHAAEPVAPVEPSPYLPTTRRFVSPLYIRVEEIPETGYLSGQDRSLLQWHADDALRLDEVDLVDRDASWRLKDAALRLVHRVTRSPRRERDFAAFREREGQGLVDFATWCALSVAYGEDEDTWPTELQDSASEAVEAKRQELADEVDYFCWLQWIVEDQLGTAQRVALESGMRLGLIHDLAVGVHPSGADAWGLRDALARGVTVGAPADQYNQLGQDWSQPPWRPDQLAELGYAPYRDMLRTVLRSAGGLRVDHIIGLFRLWWIPQGCKPFEGTYVRYDHDALIGILALEAHRAGAVVIGEDLGTVEPWVRDYLADRGVMGTSILWFERDYEHGGEPIQPESYRRLCLATVTTHDLPPTAGYLQQVHIDLRHELGLLTRPIEEERASEVHEQEGIMALLRSRGLLREGASHEDTIEALHKLLSWTPALLRGISVSDLALDVRIINQPGTDEEYPNWRMPLAGPDGRPVLLEELMRSPWARRLARTLA
ncbi:4-alpha-glucanotransferase [Arsenicicoccus sp. oral taxon 190]|uniref:4-alpha-glucanotransferase n=1 Tax=Arsenicicoccus sp. oral taxon 190 TaxID=1658671 RepID=UPI00067A0048|nr:4-alpha-glucanotransferase [Arsenicicoccus sp. oral taxon 190]AKT51512.1 4-alpha-glucanotransferase [Arsenicicoccus sp. oral taxon 190]